MNPPSFHLLHRIHQFRPQQHLVWLRILKTAAAVDKDLEEDVGEVELDLMEFIDQVSDAEEDVAVVVEGEGEEVMKANLLRVFQKAESFARDVFFLIRMGAERVALACARWLDVFLTCEIPVYPFHWRYSSQFITICFVAVTNLLSI